MIPGALLWAADATIVLVGAFASVRLRHGGTASSRHLILAAAFAALAALPLALWSTPVVIRLEVPQTTVSTLSSLMASTPKRSAALAMSRPPASTSSPTRPTWDMSRVVPVVWLLGAGLCAMRVWVGVRRTRGIRRGAIRWPDGDTLARGHGVEVLLHDALTGPITFGVVRPAIVFPASARDWSREDVSRAFAHELEHVHRHDWAVLCATSVICAAYWWHPLVWIAARRLRLEAEKACDDAALEIGDGRDYADQLVRLAEHAIAERALWMAMARRGDLAERVNAILDSTRPRHRRTTAGTAVMTTAAAITVFCLTPYRVGAATQIPVRLRPSSSTIATGPAADDAVPVADSVARARARVAALPRHQSSNSAPRFEVASVKENKSGSDRSAITTVGNRVTITNVPLRFIILEAYGLRDHELADAPAWTTETAYNITGTFPGGQAVSQEDARAMLRDLLGQRFGLTVRHESRILPAYSLVAVDRARPGPRLTKSHIDCDQWTAAARPPFAEGPPSLVAPDGRRPLCRLVVTRRFLTGGTVGIDRVAAALQSLVQRPVVDGSGLAGAFDVDLNWEFDESTSDAVPASIFTAVQEQLGLKLESTRTPFDVTVVASIRRAESD